MILIVSRYQHPATSQELSPDPDSLELKYSFLIEGRNPIHADAHAYIQSEPLAVSTFYCTWGVAKHESAQDEYDALYCQFNGGGPAFTLPNYGFPKGWGIFQRDDSGGQGAIPVTRDQVYSWKINSDIAVQEELAQKWNRANIYLGNLRNAHPAQYDEDPPPNYATGVGTTFSALDTLTMEAYNGAGLFTSLLKFVHSNKVGHRWVWGNSGKLPPAPGKGNSKPYVDLVAERMSTVP